MWEQKRRSKELLVQEECVINRGEEGKNGFVFWRWIAKQHISLSLFSCISLPVLVTVFMRSPCMAPMLACNQIDLILYELIRSSAQASKTKSEEYCSTSRS